jgi:uncharacterized protein with ParB-like and HNH nuclease domain
MSQLSNKIEAHDRSIDDVLNNKKYTVDYFQREYNWEEKHIEQLVSDLTSTFLMEYKEDHQRTQVEKYNVYYLGPFVVSEKEGNRSIIDGQQRLTSLTLLLIFLNNLQKELGYAEEIASFIFSEKFGRKSFNIQVDERINCLEQLFKNGEYTIKEDDDESTINMANRYQDIEKSFPDELKNGVLLYFLDWLKYRVILVEIIAYSDENAYTIFETMNDRGLNLTPTEMLKGFVLSKFDDLKKRKKANEFWQQTIQKLHEYDKTEDQRFIQAWLRAQYAETIRPGKAGSKNEDFEKIGTRFHSWFRDNLDKMKINPDISSDFENILNIHFKFFYQAYIKILDAEITLNPELEHVFYIKRWGIATSLSYPLLIASLSASDSPEVVNKKLNLVAAYIEIFVVRRAVNFRKFASSSIRYTMYSLAKEIRNKTVEELEAILREKLVEMPEKLEGINDFRLHGQNKYFVKFLLSRISGFIETNTGSSANFNTFFHNPGGKSFEVEHIWADKYADHKNEFEQEHEFHNYRNRLGGLLLLPRGTNQSYGSKPYSEKIGHYIKENLLVKSLCPKAYENNPNFISMYSKLGLPFKPHPDFNKADIDERQNLYLEIARHIWEM